MNCTNCGKELLDGTAVCDGCGAAMTAQPVAPEKKENVLTGVVGALIGAALGAASIILLSQLGYVAAVSGLILSVCTLKGYELLGGKLSTRGIVISCLLMAVTPYFADRLSWAIALSQELSDLGVTVGQMYTHLHELIKEAEATSEYLKNLALVYLFTVLGAFSTLRGLFRKKK